MFLHALSTTRDLDGLFVLRVLLFIRAQGPCLLSISMHRLRAVICGCCYVLGPRCLEQAVMFPHAAGNVC